MNSSRGGVTAKPAFRKGLAIGVVLLSLGCLYGPSLRTHMRQSGEYYNDDATQHVAPFLRPITDHPRDYTERYWMANIPLGYKALYRSGGLFTSPKAVSRWIPYPLLLMTALLMAIAAYRFGGLPAAWGAAALTLSADIFLSQMTGGLMRAFAFPLIACAAAAAVWGRPYLLAGTVCAAAAFYPAMAVPSGLALAAILLVLPSRDRNQASEWSLAGRGALVAVTALIAALIVLPNVLAIRQYGPLIGPADLKDFPEARRGGRLGGDHRVDYDAGVVEAVQIHSALAFENKGEAWLPAAARRLSGGLGRTVLFWILAGVSLPGSIRLVAGKAAGRRLLALSCAVLLSYLLSRWLSPYLFLPNRHVRFPVPLLALLWFVASAGALPEAFRAIAGPLRSQASLRRLQGTSVLLLSLLCLLLIGGRIYGMAGLSTPLHKGEGLYSFLASLPEDSFIAGWPNWMAPVPLISERAVLVSQETHLPYHARYTLEMRRRMRLLIDAYFARSAEALVKLRDEMGVTHLVVNQGYLEGAPSLYFRPFIGWVRRARFPDPPGGFEAIRQKERAGIFEDGTHFVLDLSRVRGG